MYKAIVDEADLATLSRPPEDRKRILVVAGGSFPSRIQPVHGVFVNERVRFVNQLPHVDVRVVSPTPYFPPIKRFKHWYPWSQVPRHEIVDGLEVLRPRYFLPPKVGGYFHPRLMLPAAKSAIRQLHRQGFDFDLLDAHFVYPNGVLATALGKRYGKPVVITGRGEDIAKFPDYPIIGKQIRQTLRSATQLIAVSGEIAERMERLGADPRKITVIPNGVDCDKFYPESTDVARGKLNLPAERPIVLAVGYRLELKGFHLLVDAIPRIRERFPNVLVAIVGGQARWAADYLPEIEERIRANGVADHVLLPGVRPQDELKDWYSAADVLSILSSREGSPNVLMEALACGLPAVATRVGGIPDVLKDSRLGLLLTERSAEAAATGLITALSNQWDRQAIRSTMERRSWHATAERVNQVFDRALSDFRSSNISSSMGSTSRHFTKKVLS